MSHSARILRTALAAAALSVCLAVTASAAYGTGTVTGDSLRLRQSASTGSAILATVPKGTQVDVLENQKVGWYKVDYNGIVGYMSANWLSVSVTPPPAEPTLGTGTLNTAGSSLNMRSGPGTGYSKVGSIPATATLTITGEENGWYKTSYNGVTGYVSSTYVVLSGSTPSTPSTPAPSAPTTPPADTALGTGTLDTDGSSLNMRSGPGTGYNKVGSIPATATLTITGEENGWYKTSYKGVSGYVSSDYVILSAATPAAPSETPSEPPAETPSETPSSTTLGYGTLDTRGSSLNMRSGPGTGYNKLASIPASAVLTITGSENGWYKTSYNGVSGYVSSDYVILSATKPETPSAPAANTNLAAQLIDYAKQFMGRPYVYGAEGPNSFDCSGFTQYVFKHFGYSLSRSAASQYNNGVSIDISQIQPGDLIFWRAYGSSKTATHVGIYIGGNQYIHASSTAGYITINDMGYGSNARYIVGIRRILT